MEVSCRFHAPAALPQEKAATHWGEGWVGPTAGQGAVQKRRNIPVLPGTNPIRPVRSLVTIQNEISRKTC